MRNFILDLFHGIGMERYNMEWGRHEQEILYRMRQIDDLKDQIKKLEEDNKYLRDLIFKDKGVIQSESPAQNSTHFNPVSLSRPTWPRVREQLERQDRARVEAQKQVDDTERHWKSKMEQELNQEVENYLSGEEKGNAK